MICFLTTRGHEYTVRDFAQQQSRAGSLNLGVLPYDRFLRRKWVSGGTYVFTDLERLMPWETTRAAEAFRSVAAAPGSRGLNDPARAMTRYELLRNLKIDGINDFDVHRVDERRYPSRYPVFLRREQDHRYPLSDLIHSPQALDEALRRLRESGTPMRGVLIVEYAAAPFEPTLFRKFSTFRIGGEVFAHHILTQDNWNVKYGNEGVVRPEWMYEYEQAFVIENRHQEVIRRAFEIGGIEFGRADFGVIEGRVQIYEINTNPDLRPLSDIPSKVHQRTVQLSQQKMVASLAALDSHDPLPAVKLDGPLLKAYRHNLRWFERPERRP